ncbi:MAG TPA: SOS response-associated peptidase family protein, partial [Rhizobiaceae bacterium]|nr:SOS response-associated peptidase family protein [Rhizobiaceae bacterium]
MRKPIIVDGAIVPNHVCVVSNLHNDIVVTRDGHEIAELHDRMPVILEPADWPVWLGEAAGDPGFLRHPSPYGTLRTWPVDRRVNSP